MKPSTVFVSCQSFQHLDVLRACWARRVLKPAAGFNILSLGDMGGIQIDRVEQTQFVPLADVICDVIAQLNRLGQAATHETLATEIHVRFAGVQPPSVAMISQTLSGLIRTGLVYQMGQHLFVSVPAAAVPSDKPSYPYHVAPVSSAAPVSCTVECQTGKSIINGGCNDEAAKENDAANDAKAKAAKRGIFARLFARKDNHTSPAKGKKAASSGLATFTAQFPPPNWICSNSNKENAVVEDIKTKRFYTFPENLCKNQPSYDDDETTEADTYINLREVPAAVKRYDQRRNRDKRRSRRYYISGSSECLDYGPIDPPECLPAYDAEIIEQIKPQRMKQRRRTVHVPSSRVPVRTSTPINAVVAVSRRGGSDSAYSASPVMPEGSESTTFFAHAASASWSEDNCAQTSSDGVDSGSMQGEQHIYVNLGPTNDSTQFEEITQTENCAVAASTLKASEYRADTRNIFPVNL
ncbi:hypothetical protein L596_005493 [Steinernema carpocapsae]|uniref:Winged helix Storkhead-box1 domain-containing protein n=1 Tax=Steinernema carpocapsae TaxID=34508 RepID=A0A4V6I8N5_STECR|nr:hypothetical protein L596_005493 [Steinernema carpocapsae]